LKNIIVITGGAGFVGSNLIEFFVKRTNFKILSIDNYSSGSKKNHILNKKVKYVDAHTKDIHKILNAYKRSYKINFSFWRVFKNFSKFLTYG
jgi:UDP-glucose 4-epimerase